MKYFLSFILAFMLCACATKPSFSHSKSVFVSLITDQIKLSEAGFLYQDNDNLRLEVYKLAQPLFVLELKGTRLCLNKGCLKEEEFNKRFFKNAHYKGFLRQILTKKALYDGLNLIQTSCGFEQNITNKAYELSYEICEDKIFFEDKKARMKFSLREIK